MSFSSGYFSRYPHYPVFHNSIPANTTGIIVVIPCYDDEFIFNTLNSLEETDKPNSEVEVIVVVNSGINTPACIIKRNRIIYEKLKELAEKKYFTHFQLLPILIEATPLKQAGVGNARKAGMDEAVRRFDSIGCPQGIIASLDADCLVRKDYFILLEKAFTSNKNRHAYTIQFQHNLDSDIYTQKEIEACALYETYLRYFRLALEITRFPYCFHTIGSCFAVDALAYIKAGGMSHKQGGEDFYFLHKLAQLTEIGTIPEPIVFPAPRISDRVPFGTGPTIKRIINKGQYKVYNFKLFLILKCFFDSIPGFYTAQKIDLTKMPEEIINFAGADRIKDIIMECKKNSKEEKSFMKRCFSKFDAFFIIKFLNSFNENISYPPMDISDASISLLNHYYKNSNKYNPAEIQNALFHLDTKLA